MKSMVRLFAFVGGFLAFMSLSASVQAAEMDDSTLSPYFLVKSNDPAVDRLPLLLTSADVKIAGVIADVTVTQIYKNEGTQPLEAIYVFPGSTRAAVYGMTMTVGDRMIVAKIQEKQQAKQTYETAKKAGKTASLLEQRRPNVFQMSVANILPGDNIRVDLKYTELLAPTSGVYEFVYPTVVGPRYSNQAAATAPESEQWVANPYIPEKSAKELTEEPPYLFDITTHLSTGIPLQMVNCSSHDVKIDYQNPSAAAISLSEEVMIEKISKMPPERLSVVKQALFDLYGEDFGNLPLFYQRILAAATASAQPIETEQARTVKEFGGDRDYVLRYRLADKNIESGLLLYKGESENFFLLMVQPPASVTSQVIPPRDYVFIMDVSGSMQGFPIDTSKTLLRNLISGLRPTDTFNVVLFAGASAALSEQSLPATAENVEKALRMIDQQQGGGGTELLPALRQALGLPRSEGVSRSIVIATDGFVNVETEAFDLIRSNLNQANMFAFGIGSSVNRFLIEGMARVGMGEPFVVLKPEEAAEKAEQFRRYVQSPVLTQIQWEADGFEVYDVEPLSIPDVLAERPILLFGKWQGTPTGQISVRGVSGIGEYRQAFAVSDAKMDDTHAALRYLWARKRIELLGDYNKLSANDARVKEMTNLGLAYNLLTEYTSFVAVDEVVRRTTDNLQTVKQPLPLPQGVSNAAIGVHKTPEPELSLLAVIAALLAALALRSQPARRERH